MRHLLFLFLIIQMATAASYESIWSGVKPTRVLRLKKADGLLLVNTGETLAEKTASFLVFFINPDAGKNATQFGVIC